MKSNLKKSWAEIAAVIGTGILKFVCVNLLEAKLLFISVALIGWLSFIVLRVRANRAIVAEWGFRKENFTRTFRVVALFFGVALAGFGVYAWVTGSVFLNWHILPLLVLYPVWGIIQQFLIMGLVARNLQKIGLNHLFTIALSAIAFGLVHLPDPLLTVGTTVLALFYSAVYLKWRNLWPLGLFHGWIAAFFYFLVLNRDPLAEVFGL